MYKRTSRLMYKYTIPIRMISSSTNNTYISIMNQSRSIGSKIFMYRSPRLGLCEVHSSKVFLTASSLD